MIQVWMEGYQHDYQYDVKELLKLFYPGRALVVGPAGADFEEKIPEALLFSRVSYEKDRAVVTTRYQAGETVTELTESAVVPLADELEQKRVEKLLVKRGLVLLLREQRGGHVSWGILTGIRPTKIVHDLMQQGVSAAIILDKLQQEYLIQPEKARLLLEVAETEYAYLYPTDPKKISLYVGIPFCPTRCVYCSFPSNGLERWGQFLQPYVDALCFEITETAKLANARGLVPETLYIGGGTPSVLSVEQLRQLSACLEAVFPLAGLKEFTFEAGRPDTITLEKLNQWKAMGVTRLSINPQTMHESTLQTIGRSHTTRQLKEAYQLALEAGFDKINMDIILGLPGETAEMVEQTMAELEALAPANLTVHTLAIKNASVLKEKGEDYLLAEGAEVVRMLEITQQRALEMGLRPYYLYRQKHMLGNLENVGYARPGTEGIYNIKIMEEQQTILAFGAGAISKFIYSEEKRLERSPNVKNLEHYLARVEEMVRRKAAFLDRTPVDSR